MQSKSAYKFTLADLIDILILVFIGILLYKAFFLDAILLLIVYEIRQFKLSLSHRLKVITMLYNKK